MAAKKIRMSRFFRRGAGAGLLVPIDHGLTMGPLDGIRSLAEMETWITHPAISGVIAHKGIIERLARRGLLDGVGVMIHLNGMAAFTPTPNRKELFTSVRAAQRLGADAVSVQVNFDGDSDAHNLVLLGQVVDAAQSEGMPVLAMVYDKAVHQDNQERINRQQHLIRLAIELGVDALKLAPPASARRPWELQQILRDHCDDTAIFFAGGAQCDEADLVALAKAAVERGAAGLCVGRNVFGSAKPDLVLTELDRVMNGVPSKVGTAGMPEKDAGDRAVKASVH